MPAGMGKKGGVYPGLSDAWLLPLCWQCMYVVCAGRRRRRRRGDFEEPCAYCLRS